MRKILAYMLFLIFICMAIPVIFTNRKIETTSGNIVEDEGKETDKREENNEYNYAKYSKIKLLHEKTNSIEEIEIDEYLYGVVSSEMPASFEIEALKAQAVAARTYTIYKINNNILYIKINYS